MSDHEERIKALEEWRESHNRHLCLSCGKGHSVAVMGTDGAWQCEHCIGDDTAETVAPTRTSWRPTTKTPTESDSEILSKYVDGFGRIRYATMEGWTGPLPKPHRCWIPLSEVLAAIDAAEIPDLERRMDERFPNGWCLTNHPGGYLEFRPIDKDGRFGKIDAIGNSLAAAMRAALEAK